MELITPEVERVASTQLAIIDRIAAIVVTNDAEADEANETLKQMREAAKRLEADRVALKAPSLEACRRVDEFFKGKIELLTNSGIALKAKIAGYLDAKEKKRAEEEARLKAIADAERKKLEDIARKKEAEAAAARAKAEQEAENARRASEEAERKRKEAEEAGNRKEAERQAALAAKEAERARSAVEAGAGKAAELETTAANTREVANSVSAAATVPAAGAKPKGFSTRTVYGCEVVNFKALVDAVAAGKQPIHLLQANESGLRSMAAAAKESFNVEGCKLTKRQA